MAIRLPRKKLIYSGITGAGIMLVLCSGGGYLAYQEAQEREIELKEQYRAELDELAYVAQTSQYAFALKEPVKRGEAIEEANLEKVYLPEAAASSDLYFFNLNDENGKDIFARADLDSKTVLTSAVIYEGDNITNDVREIEYGFIELPSKLQKDEYVDVRIQFPSGEDYVLLTKKKVKDLQGVTVWFDIEEGEILSMASGIYDAYVEGARIYAVEYVDDLMQVPATMTYPVRNNIREIIEKSPNVIDRYKIKLEAAARERLESSLKALDDSTKQAVQTGKVGTSNRVEVDSAKREAELTAEERINAANESNVLNQEELVGGTGE